MPWKRNARLVRGLDYYRHTAFEFVTDRLGAQGTVIAGGRYDGLIESLGRPAHAGSRLGRRDRAPGDDDRGARSRKPQSVAVVPLGERAEAEAQKHCRRLTPARASRPTCPIAAT